MDVANVDVIMTVVVHLQDDNGESSLGALIDSAVSVVEAIDAVELVRGAPVKAYYPQGGGDAQE